jgi:hypothetical protein
VRVEGHVGHGGVFGGGEEAGCGREGELVRRKDGGERGRKERGERTVVPELAERFSEVVHVPQLDDVVSGPARRKIFDQLLSRHGKRRRRQGDETYVAKIGACSCTVMCVKPP